MGAEIGGDIRGHKSFDVARMSSKAVVAAGAEVAIVGNFSAAGTGLHQRSGDGIQVDLAADGRQFNVAVFYIDQSDGSAHRADVDVAVIDVTHKDDRFRTFQSYVSPQAFHRQGTVRGSQVD